MHTTAAAARTPSGIPFFGAMERFISQMETGSYPPYNLVRQGETTFIVELAVAGFAEEDLSVEVTDQRLVVEGKIAETDKNDDVTYLHRGIARRAFRHIFELHETMKVTGASLTDGLLTISIEKEIPEVKKPRTVEIQTAS